MKSAILEQVEKQSTFTGDVLEQLTVAHAEHLNRHGPVFGLSQVAPPDDAAAFAAEQRRKGEVLAVSPDPRTRAGLLLDIQAHQHEQIGRLAVYVAGYELAHGDKDKADPMRELGRNHLGLAAELRETMRGHFGDDFADLVAPKSPEPSKADDMNKRNAALMPEIEMGFTAARVDNSDLTAPDIRAELAAAAQLQHGRDTGRGY